MTSPIISFQDFGFQYDAQAELDKSVERINAKLERYTRE